MPASMVHWPIAIHGPAYSLFDLAWPVLGPPIPTHISHLMTCVHYKFLFSVKPGVMHITINEAVRMSDGIYL